ncbi:type IV pili methyl-accepting chemotaxis transducer N-terminal domain-containing protein [Aquimarina agarivorans]|uniref:type IV pili methyl-accepting chemotaxis transducer N-terminal domain-containing protein n=1 Tax=Aquimarina agarivorans TaxID=980584 RepID=UPI000248E9D3|nr:type IV pili methyl-accepting chemotaxis transducer N-terminal domain-containing protein [Aquimarina agarivorans]
MQKLITLSTITLLCVINFSFANEQEKFGNISYEKATNISGKQRMLSQRIAKIYLLRLAGANGNEVNSEYNSSLQLFQRNLSILETNSKKSSPKVRAAVKREKEQWETFKNIINNRSNKNLNNVMTSSNELLKRCHSLVLAIEEDSKYSKEFSESNNEDQLKVETVNLSGKQRMLSQRLCLYYTACRVFRKEKLNYKGLCVEVEKIYAEMNNSLNSLLINDLNTFTIEQKIGEVLTLFNQIEDNKRDFFNNKIPLSKIMMLSNKITNLYNIITGQYTSL